MAMPNKKVYVTLLILSQVFALAALCTLLPNPRASWPSILGYRSLCSFAPIATAICALLAGATCVVRARLFGPQAGYRKPWTVPVIVGIVLALAIAFSIPPYAKAKADARSGATATRSAE